MHTVGVVLCSIMDYNNNYTYNLHNYNYEDYNYDRVIVT